MSQSVSATSAQVETLLEFLNEHRDLARGHLRSADGRLLAKRLWDQITQMLNGMGGAIKTVQQWQKVWTDKKHLAKKTVAIVKKDVTGTGGGPPNASLSNVDLLILEIMGEGFGERQTSARVPAFPNRDLDGEVASYRVDELIESASPPPLTPPPPHRPLHRQNCAERQLSVSVSPRVSQPMPSPSGTLPNILNAERQLSVSVSPRVSQPMPSPSGTLPNILNAERQLSVSMSPRVSQPMPSPSGTLPNILNVEQRLGGLSPAPSSSGTIPHSQNGEQLQQPTPSANRPRSRE